MDHQIPPVTFAASSNNQCLICDSSASGMNFGVLTCAPCKAFFQSNARRKELLDLPCRHETFAFVVNNNLYLRQNAARYLQIRCCSTCRLRRCFELGMKEELVQTNRQRQQELEEQVAMIDPLSVPQAVQTPKEISDGIDWRHLSNIVYAYDTQCIKNFADQRAKAFGQSDPTALHQPEPVGQPAVVNTCVVSSIISFVQSLPAFYTLSKSTQNHLRKTNIRPLMFPNVYELEQCCFADSWQSAVYAATWKMVCGPDLYVEFRRVQKLCNEYLLTDPVITRLWIITLLFSTPLHYHNDNHTVTPLLKKKRNVFNVQTAYATLLWKYLLCRHDEMGAVRIFSNLIRIYVKMQQVGYGMYLNLHSKQELVQANEVLQQLVTANENDGEGNDSFEE